MPEASSHDDLENTTFSTALRGYDRDEVDAFVRTVAQEMRELHQSRSEKLYESLGEEMGGLLQHARESADEMTRRAEEDAAATRAQAEADAQKTRDEAAGRARELQEQTEKQAATIRADAEQDASTRIAEATERVRQLETTEGQARERIKSMRAELASIANELQLIEATPEAGRRQDKSKTERAAEPDEDEEHETIRREPQESSIS